LSATVHVIGAGAAGLAAAAELQRYGKDVLVLEASANPAGVAQSDKLGGYRIERGPNTFRVGPDLARFLAAHALDPLLRAASPASRKRFLLRRGELVEVPGGLLAFATTPLLSIGGKLRLLAEPFVRRGDARGESVADFIARRFGRETLEALVAPFLTGVYAGDETRLGAEAVFPSLVEAERRRGSVALGLLRGAGSRARGRPGTWSASEGVGTLLGELARRLASRIRCATPVQALGFDRTSRCYELALADGERLTARGVVIATPAPEAARLLAGLDSGCEEILAAIRYVPVASLSLGIDPGRLRRPVEGFGYLVPREEGGVVLGCLFPSQLFPDRAPRGRELLTVLIGGERHPEAVAWPEAQLRAKVQEELDAVLGLRQVPEWLSLARWPRAVPQPGPDHPRQIRALRRRLHGFPHLVLAGGYLDGVAFGDALVSGAAAAREVATQEAR